MLHNHWDTLASRQRGALPDKACWAAWHPSVWHRLGWFTTSPQQPAITTRLVALDDSIGVELDYRGVLRISEYRIEAAVPERIWKWWGELYAVPLHFFDSLRVQLVVLVSVFVMVSKVWSISCLLFFYSRCPTCPTICKSGCTCPRAMRSRRHWTEVNEECGGGGRMGKIGITGAWGRGRPP